MTFAIPTGSARMPAVAIEVPPDRPADSTPPSPRSRAIQTAKASAIPVTDAPRSPDNTWLMPRGWQLAIWLAGMSARAGLPEVDRSTILTLIPIFFRRLVKDLNSSPLVSNVPATSTVRPMRSA